MTPSDEPVAGRELTLLELAEQSFAPLSHAERELFRAAQAGSVTSALAQTESENDPIKSEMWTDDRIVRAKCVAWVCSDPLAVRLVNPRGVDLYGMRIEGDLDLNKTKIEFSVSARQCAFCGSILLRRAEVRGLYFSRCHMKSPKADQKDFKAFDAEGAKISGGLWLKDRCKVEGEVSLLGTAVTGEFDCSGTHFASRGADDISADGMKIEGDVLLIGCKAKRTVRFLGATISGDLNCGGARFSKEEGEAFNGDGIRVEGDVLLDDGFETRGLVRLSASRIGGNLDCSSAQFLNAAEALQLEEASIVGNILFSNLKAEGEVNLTRTVIGGYLDCEGAQLLNVEDALTADALKVNGDVTFGEGFRADGEVRLFGAKIGGDLDCSGAKFIHAGGALSLDGAEIAGDVKFIKVEIKGRIGFPGATIGGDLDFEKTEITKGGVEGEEDCIFTAEGAKIEGTVFFVNQFRVEGQVSLIGATVGGDLDFRSAEFHAPGSDAISAHRAKISGDVIFGDGFQADGEVSFYGAMIGGDLNCKDAKFSNRGGDALSAESAKIERSVNLHKGLDLRGCLNLQNGELRRRLDLRGLSTSEETTLNLRSTAVGSIQDDEATWGSADSLRLDGFTYERFHTEGPVEAERWIKWLQQQPRARFIPQPYEQLALVLRRMGHERDAKRVMIAKNQDRARFTKFGDQGWWWYNFFGRAIGYGYAPWRAFVGSLAMILIGFLLFSLGSNDLISPTKETAYEKDAKGTFVVDARGKRLVSKEYPAFSPFFYSLEAFTPLLKLDQGVNWAPNANGTDVVRIGPCFYLTGRVLRYYLYCHVILGWLLTSLWVGAVTGLVKS